MSGISPIPTTRVGDLFVRQQLVGQVQQDQLELFRLQMQISTGRRFQVPSEDPLAALRAINLQRILDRKGQVRKNLEVSRSYVEAAWTRITNLSAPLADLRAQALGAAGTVAPESDRLAAIKTIDELLPELVNAGNAKFQSRYLFAGSRGHVQPYEFNGEFVEYRGNEGVLRSYIDLERLFETNVDGPQTFGGISSAIRGSVDLNPHLTPDTLLSTINRGAGISPNSAVTLSVNTGSTTLTSVVDLSGAVTIGDVARLIESGAPTGTSITAEVTGTGLRLTTGSGTVQVSEVAEGRAARELGFPPTVSPGVTITGADLNPKLLKTTPLGNLLGTKAQGRIVSAGVNNDIVITAAQNGTDLNDVTVEFVVGGVAGSETVSYDTFTKTLTVQVQDGVSRATQVAAAITADGRFNAAVDYRDASTTDQAGSGAVEVANFGLVTSGGSSVTLDTTSGLILTNGDQSVTLDLSAAETVEDLLNRIMGSDLGFLAQINAAGNGIDVRSRRSGADFTIGENGGTTATQLGIRTYTGATELDNFNRGVGVPTSDTADDIEIVASDGSVLSIDLTGATTVQDVLDRINTAAVAGGVSITVRLAVTGNGIDIVDATGGVGTIAVNGIEGSQAAEYLGFIPNGAVTVDGSGNQVLTSEDRHTLETDSIFNTLLRLRSALEAGNIEEIGRAIDRLDADTNRLNLAAAELGIRLQNLEVVDFGLQDENVQLRSALANDLDVDLIEAISNLTARQYAFEASLRTSASLLQLSLLDFI